MASYRELYKDTAIIETQQLITEFIIKNAETWRLHDTRDNFVQDITKEISPIEEADNDKNISSDRTEVLN